MRVVRTEGGPAWLTVGFLIACLVALLGILGMLGVVPYTPLVIFALLTGLAVAIIL